MESATGELLLALAPTSASAAEARRAVTAAIRSSRQPALAGDVGVVVSELVTNAVRHARHQVEVRVLQLAPGVRVEVTDDGEGDLLPVQTLAHRAVDQPLANELGVDLEGTTGRGLLIVGALSDSWGFAAAGEGRVVWAEIGTGRRERPRVPAPHSGMPTLLGTSLMPVRLIAVPVRLALASQANVDDVTRELELASPGHGGSEVRELLRRVRSLLADLGETAPVARQAAARAFESGRRLMDVNLALTPGADRLVDELVAVLEAVAEHSRAGDLLSLAPTDEVLAFRRWCAGEIQAQVDGVRPTACPFPVRLPADSGSALGRPAPLAETRADRSAGTLLELQAVTAALAGADDTGAVNDIVLTRVGQVAGATTASISLLGSDGETLELVGSSGYADTVTTHWSTYPLSADLPASEAVRTGIPVFLRSPAELVEDYPSLAGRPIVGSESIAVLPLSVADGRVLGALALGYATPRDWVGEDRAILGLLADAIAQALDRARLHDAERLAAERLRFLAQASDVLSRSLDPNSTMRALAELAVPRLGDWCSIHILRDGQVTPVALAAVDDEKLDLARTLQTNWPVVLGEGAIGRCLAEGEPGVWQVVPDEILPTIARDADHLEVLRALGLGSGVVVPLITAGAVVGALAVANVSGRPIDASDVDLAHDLALRAGAAIANARLYGEQRDIAQALQRSLLPLALPTVSDMDLGVAYAAAGVGQEVGGDFYDVMTMPDGLLVTIGDVRGRGVEAAALTGLARHTIRALGRLELPPDEILRRLDGALRDSALPDEPEAAFCTALTGRLERQPGHIRFSFASGGHPAPFLLRAGAVEVQRPSVRGDLLGLLPDVELVITELPLHAGDLLVLVTDGVLERRHEGEFFDDEGVARTILGHHDESAHDLAQTIARAARDFAPGETSDDMAVVVVRIR